MKSVAATAKAFLLGSLFLVNGASSFQIVSKKLTSVKSVRLVSQPTPQRSFPLFISTQDEDKITSVDNQIYDLFFRPDGKKSPIFGTPYFRPWVYAIVDFSVEIWVIWLVLYHITGNAQVIYTVLATGHGALCIVTDYATKLPPKYNFPVVPLVVMGMYDNVLDLFNVTTPWLLASDFDSTSKWTLLIGGMLSFFMKYAFIDVHPRDPPVTTEGP